MKVSIDMLQDVPELSVRQPDGSIGLPIAEAQQPHRKRNAEAFDEQGFGRRACVVTAFERSHEMFDPLIPDEMARVEPAHCCASHLPRDVFEQGGRQANLDCAERGFRLETALLVSGHEVDVASTPQKVSSNVTAIRMGGRAGVNHDPVVMRSRQPEGACFDMPRNHCYARRDLVGIELCVHTGRPRIHSKTCPRFGGSCATFNAGAP